MLKFSDNHVINNYYGLKIFLIIFILNIFFLVFFNYAVKCDLCFV